MCMILEHLYGQPVASGQFCKGSTTLRVIIVTLKIAFITVLLQS